MGAAVRFSWETVRRALLAFPEIGRVEDCLFEDSGLLAGMVFRVYLKECDCWVKLKITEAVCLEAGTFVLWVRESIKRHQCVYGSTLVELERWQNKENARAALMAYTAAPIAVSKDAEDWLAKTVLKPATPEPPQSNNNETAKRFGALDFDDKEPND